MAFFSKPVAELDFADLQVLVDDGAVENIRLEFKREMPERHETLKKVSAFANTYGGDIVVGAEEDGEGSIEALPGVEPPRNYKQTIGQWCMDGLSPPLTPFISEPIPVSHDDERVLFVIRVAESQEGPHFINGRKGCYVRTDEFSNRFESRQADQGELRHLLDRRRLAVEKRRELQARSDARFQAYIERDYEASEGTVGEIGATLRLWIGPRFPVRMLTEPKGLSRVVEASQITVDGVLFPRLHDVFWQHESLLRLRPDWRFSFLEITTWGTLDYAIELEEVAQDTDGDGKDEGFVRILQMAGNVLMLLKYAPAFFRALGYDGSLMVRAGLERIRGVPFIRPSYGGHRVWHTPDPRSLLDDDFAAAVTTDPLELLDQADPTFRRTMTGLGFGIGWPALVSDEEWARLRPEAYAYNRWPKPE